MVDIYDLKDATETVQLDDQSVALRGITIDELAALAMRFPPLGDLLNEGVNIDKLKQVGGAELLRLGAGAVAAIIAVGFNHPGDERAEKKAATLMPGVQLAIIDGILRCTLEGPAGPLADRLRSMGRLLFAKAAPDQQSKPSPSRPKP